MKKKNAQNFPYLTRLPTRCLSKANKRSRLNTDTLLAQNVQDVLAGPVVLEDVLSALGSADVLKVLLEEVRAVHGATLGLRVELGREDGPGAVHHSLVAAVVEVDKVLLEIVGQGAGVDGVSVVLRSDVALAGGQVQSRDVVGSVAVLHLDGLCADGHGQKLVAETDSHDGDGRGLHQAGKVVDGLLAVDWVAGPVGDEDTVKVVGNLVDWVVVREDGERSTTADQAAEDVLLDTTVDQSNVEVSIGRLNHEGSLGADALDQVDLARVDKAFVLIGIVLVANGDPSEGRTLLSEKGDNGSSVDAGNGGNTLTGTPIAQTLDGGPVAVLKGDVGDNNTSALDVRRFKVLQKVVLVTLTGGNAVVANQGLGEDEDLATVRGVGHGFGVADERSGEDGLARDVGIGTKGLASENGAILFDIFMLAHSLLQYSGVNGASYSDSKGSRKRSAVLSSLERHSLSLCSAGKSLARHESGLESNSASGARGSSGRFLGKIGRQLGEHGSGLFGNWL